MGKSVIKKIFVCFAFFITFSSAYASSPKEEMINMLGNKFEKSMYRSCEDRQLLGCLSLSNKQCMESTKFIVEDCRELYLDAASSSSQGNGGEMLQEAKFKKVSSCISNSIIKRTGVSRKLLDKCS